MPSVSVLIPCFNSEATIRRAFESVRWADEIVVVDSYSTDRTLEIAHEYTSKIHQRKYVNSANQKNWAIPLCAGDWVLQLDSDEELEPGLAEEIREAVGTAPPELHCFRLRRKNLVYGTWIKSNGFYPDFQTRLYRKAFARYEEKSVHARILVPGRYGELRGHLLHHDFKSIGDYLLKFERYMRYELEELVKRGHRLRWWDLALKPPAVFARGYLLQGGWREGFPGLLQSYLVGAYVFMKYAKLWEYEWRRRQKG
jgi:glycosyltransferase involved in cell wall biosynthesis